MRKIKYCNNEISIDEYIKRRIITNNGYNSLVYRQDLIYECKSRKIPVKYNLKKKQLVELLISNGVTCRELAEKFKIGVTAETYQNTFGITYNQVNKLKRMKVIDVIGQQLDGDKFTPLYDIYQFASISEEVIKNTLHKKLIWEIKDKIVKQ